MEKKVITQYEQCVDYINDIPKFTSKHSIEDTVEFLTYLGNPDVGMNIIHVAGSNGKGSVCAYLRSMLEEADKTVCLFTSPHLVDIRERFIVKGHMISSEKFLQAFLQIYDAVFSYNNENNRENMEFYHPTFFEYLFFMAMLIFKEADMDVVILETGLGGLLDATNSVRKKALSVITGISLEHTEYLGNTLQEVAFQKAGIIKNGCRCVFADREKEVSEVFIKVCEEQKVPYRAVDTSKCIVGDIETNFDSKTIAFSLRTVYYGIVGCLLPTNALYQAQNAAVAVAAFEEFTQGKEDVSAIQKGLLKCKWAGRMEEVCEGVFLDGAHNDDGIRALLETVKADGCRGRRILLFSVVSDKDYRSMADRIKKSNLFDSVYIAPMDNKRALDLDTLQKVFNIDKANCYTGVKEAYRYLKSIRKPKDHLYITGSLYLVGEIKGYEVQS
ncbi:MAG: bifunctional folylpolyglutamate synthase/dihydrofolate synthase [Lachnospiraceae bacterium]|nr:bifunctional folylpolyglutamate synthase/dihydrofolate synthase [Lachnospiraceae bacterium]